jgi:hypothetical protein
LNAHSSTPHVVIGADDDLPEVMVNRFDEPQKALVSADDGVPNARVRAPTVPFRYRPIAQQ